jgi:hypothetical protein
MKTITLSVVVVVLMMMGTSLVYAEQFGHQYYWGWRDGYYMWVFSAQTHDNYSWPNDDETHPYNYWQGADAAVKYAKEHVMVKVIRGHVLTELNATEDITDYFDGQNQQIWNGTITKPYSTAFMTGYNTTYGILPLEVDPNNLAQKLSGP